MLDWIAGIEKANATENIETSSKGIITSAGRVGASVANALESVRLKPERLEEPIRKHKIILECRARKNK